MAHLKKVNISESILTVDFYQIKIWLQFIFTSKPFPASFCLSNI